jgi:3-methylfumaryl-CoA hydratase
MIIMPRFQNIRVGDALPERVFKPTNVSLFLYNAAIWNAHRIHYDEPYSIGVEKHPAIVIDGPLQGDWLTQAAVNWAGDEGQLVEFEYSNRKASYLGASLTSGGVVKAVDAASGNVTLELFIKDEDGAITSTGSAVVHFAK